ncbi:hypothetical protein QQ045_030910 [Rhodiola kirilowii]
MENEKQEEDDKDGVVVVELKISMHCNACERSVANIISNVKGVEKFTTDMTRHRVVITGRIDTKKVMKKLKKKTGKRVELLLPLKQQQQQQVTRAELEPSEEQGLMKELVLFGGSHWRGCDFTTMFSDENPNACIVM